MNLQDRGLRKDAHYEKLWDIVSDFGAVLENQDSTLFLYGMRSESELPHPKNTIKRAIATLILIEQNIEILIIAYTELEKFYPHEIYNYCKSMFGLLKDIHPNNPNDIEKFSKAFEDEKIKKIMEDYQNSSNQIDKELEFLFNLAERGEDWKQHKNKVQEILEDYKKNQFEFDTDKFKEYFNGGINKNNLKDYEGAVEDFNKAIEINPTISETYIGRGLAKNNLKEYRAAIDDYNKAIELNPNYALAYFNRGVSKSNIQDYRGEIGDYNKAIDIDPELAEAYYNRGIAKINLSLKYESRLDFNKAGELGMKEAYEAMKKMFHS